MSAVAVLRLPLAVDLSGFVKLLERMQVPHRVSEEQGEQDRADGKQPLDRRLPARETAKVDVHRPHEATAHCHDQYEVHDGSPGPVHSMHPAQ